MIGRTNVGGGGGSIKGTDAILRVIAPAGSTVTISKGGVSKSDLGHENASDPTFYDYYFVIHQSQFDSVNPWTVTATLGADTASDTVTIDAADEYDIALDYGFFLYKDGNEYTSRTGGWSVVSNNGGSLTKNASDMVFKSTSGSASSFIGMASTFDPTILASYNTMYITLSDGSGNSARLCIYNQQSGTGTQLASQNITLSAGTYSLDISSVSTGWPKIACFNGQMTITRIWFE